MLRLLRQWGNDFFNHNPGAQCSLYRIQNSMADEQPIREIALPRNTRNRVMGRVWPDCRLSLFLLAALLAWAPSILLAQHGTGKNRNLFQQPRNGQGFRNNQPHLGEWIRNHQDLTPEQQIQALRAEPGFNRLPSQVQLRLQNRLNELNAMPPAQRERTLRHMEALEKLSPAQRQQMVQMMQQVSELPLDRRRRMYEAFRFLREFPVEQRQQILNSSAFQSQYSDSERQILSNVMRLEPYTPPATPGNPAANPGK